MTPDAELTATHAPSARFGAVVRELRELRGWSQEHLAGQASLNRSYMGEIERSAVMPSLATAEKLARAFDVALSELISRCEVGRPDEGALPSRH